MDCDHGIEIGAFRIEVLRGYAESPRIDIQEPRPAVSRLDGLENDRATIERHSDPRSRF